MQNYESGFERNIYGSTTLALDPGSPIVPDAGVLGIRTQETKNDKQSI
jgi:hypothetical protein